MSNTPDSLPVKPAYEQGNTSISSDDISDEEAQVQLKSSDQDTAKDNVKDGHHTFATLFKYSYSLVLLLFSVIVVTATIFTDQTKMAADVNPAVAFILLWVLTLWLAVMEGGQGCLVGLQPIDKTLYAQSHSKALKVTKLAHEGNNLERFIVGRQFLVVLVIFVINMCGSALKGASVLNLPDFMVEIFINSGVALILMTTILGQLTAQVNAADCMLDFINNYVMFITTHVSLFIEMSGLLHSVYLVQIIFAKITGKSTDSQPERTIPQAVFFWLRIVFSVAILSFSLAVTLVALFDGKTTMYSGVPEPVSVTLLFVLMAFVGMMEGMQIALFAVINMPKEEVKKHSQAAKVCDLVFSGSHLQAFLIGRQICVTCCMFIVARVATCSVDEGETTIFGVSAGIQNFFNTGLLGAIITTIIGSLAWRIIASAFPVAFLSNPLIYLIIRLCLFLEASGVCSAAWVIALVHRKLARFEPDATYLGTPDAKESTKQLEDDLELQEN
ncbi:hypothetical protein FisN_8Hh289 [Fistulifera solaris]|jgi:hypothetical protein|uniref:Silicon transporter n=1 Tax=Fistulifera solaris TaxID=1519565 RepID=A0A1Z5JYF4_FISSO|nr:hypothetical protein FisN_8Hh289 [Fistulifera solaris]|eukprot:GAX19063.1 hypothetical protein FisN_8Hh289 [Fistulifera solaris]